MFKSRFNRRSGREVIIAIINDRVNEKRRLSIEELNIQE